MGPRKLNITFQYKYKNPKKYQLDWDNDKRQMKQKLCLFDLMKPKHNSPKGQNH